MIRTTTIVLSIVLLALPAIALGEITIGGMTFDDDAFADVVVNAMPNGTGQFAIETSPPSGMNILNLPDDLALLERAITGSNVNEFVSLRSVSAQLTVGFKDLIPVDRPGADVAIFEMLTPADMIVSIGGVSRQFLSQATGEENVNVVLIDLADFGLENAPEITISSGHIFNDLSAVGAIHFVPEPSTFALASLALLSIIALGHRREYRSCSSA